MSSLSIRDSEPQSSRLILNQLKEIKTYLIQFKTDIKEKVDTANKELDQMYTIENYKKRMLFLTECALIQRFILFLVNIILQ